MRIFLRKQDLLLLLIPWIAALAGGAQKAAPPKPAAKTPAAAKGATSALDKATIEAYVRHLFVWGPQIQVKVGDPKPSPLPGLLEVRVTGAAGPARLEQTFYVSRDGQRILQANIYDVKKNPFQPELEKLKTEFQPSLGTPGAPVVLVLFTDFECPYCKEEGKVLRKNLISTYTKEVRLYFKDYPLESIHLWAKTASIAGRCVFRQNPAAFWDYHDWVFENQEKITPENFQSMALEFAQAKELDSLQLKQCLETRATEAEVNRSIEEGKALQVNATPTLFINGRRIASNIGWSQLKGIIDFEIDYQKTAHNAGDSACCEVKLPTPLNN